ARQRARSTSSGAPPTAPPSRWAEGGARPRVARRRRARAPPGGRDPRGVPGRIFRSRSRAPSARRSGRAGAGPERSRRPYRERAREEGAHGLRRVLPAERERSLQPALARVSPPVLVAFRLLEGLGDGGLARGVGEEPRVADYLGQRGGGGADDD